MKTSEFAMNAVDFMHEEEGSVLTPTGIKVSLGLEDFKDVAASRYEDTVLVCDILEQSDEFMNEVDNRDSLRLAVYDKLMGLSDELFYFFEHGLEHRYVRQGERLVWSGKPKDGLDAWSRALRVSPGNENVFSLVKEASELGLIEASEGERLVSRYRFEYLGSFGEGIVGPSFSMKPFMGNLLVSDYYKHLLHLFTSEGRHVDSLDLGIENPLTLFDGEDGSVWVCDFGNRRLVRVGREGVVVEAVELASLPGVDKDGGHPLGACLTDDGFYVLTSDRKTQRRRMHRFASPDMVGSAEDISSREFTPLGLFNIDGQAYSSQQLPARLFTYDVALGRFVASQYAGIPGNLLDVCRSGSATFFTSGGYLMKWDDAEMRFICSVGRMEELKEAKLWAMAAMRIDGGDVLYTSDLAGRILRWGV